MLQPVIIATIGLLASAVTASLSYFYTKKHQLKMEERKLKEEFYTAYIKALGDVAIDNYNDEAQIQLSKGFNSLLLIANANVIKKLMAFHDFICVGNTTLPPYSEEWLNIHDRLLTELVKAMRQDLFGNKCELKRFPVVHLVGGNKKQLRKEKHD